MPASHYIALDTHCSFCEMVVITQTGRVVKRHRCATTIPELAEALELVRRPRLLTFEEGPLANWLARNLQPFVDQLVVCEPRRNRLIAKDGDKDDAIDAEKLAKLFQGGYLKEVHQAASLDRTVFKQHVGFYHARVRERVRQGNQVAALLRRHGIFASIAELADPERRLQLFKQLPPRKVLRMDQERLWNAYEFLLTQEQEIRADLTALARREEPIRRFVEIPGFAWIRAATFYAYLDTPCRFPGKSALWRYCGIGLQRSHSGQGPTRVRLAKSANRHLKNALIGAAKSAIASDDNPFADKYRYWTKEQGMHPAVARRNVARAMAATLWSMWKSGSEYEPARVCPGGSTRWE